MSPQGKDSARSALAESGRVWDEEERGDHREGLRECTSKRGAKRYSGSRGERRRAVSSGSPGDVGAPGRCTPFPSCCSYWVFRFSRLSPHFLLRFGSSSPQYGVAGLDSASRFSPPPVPSISHLSSGTVCKLERSQDTEGVPLAAVVRRAVRVPAAPTRGANTKPRSYSPLSSSARSFVSLFSPHSESLPGPLVDLPNRRNFSSGGESFPAFSFALLMRRLSSSFISSRLPSRSFAGAPSSFLLLAIYLLLFCIVSSPYRHFNQCETAFGSCVDSAFPLPSSCRAPSTLFSPILLGVFAGSLQPPPVSFSRPLRPSEFVNDLSSESPLSFPSRRIFRFSDSFLPCSPNRSSLQTRNFSTRAVSRLSPSSSFLPSSPHPFSTSCLSISKLLREYSAAYVSFPSLPASACLPGAGAVTANQSLSPRSLSCSSVSSAPAGRPLNQSRSFVFPFSSSCPGCPESLAYLSSRELISSSASPFSPSTKEPSLSFLSVSVSTPDFSSLTGVPSLGAKKASTGFEASRDDRDTLASCRFMRDGVPEARSFISSRAESVSALSRPSTRSQNEETPSRVMSYPAARPLQSEKSETSCHQQGVAFQRMSGLSTELRGEEGDQSEHSESFRVANECTARKSQLEERGFSSPRQRFARRSVPPLLPKPPHSVSKYKGLSSLLSAVNLPSDLKKLPLHSLPQLCE